MASAGKTPKTSSRGRQEEGVHTGLPDWEEVVGEDINKDTVQVGHHGGEPAA